MDLYHLHSRTNCEFTVSCQFHDHSDVLLLLLLSLSYMQGRGRTALMLASEGGHLDVVKELLRAQADVNVQDEVCSLIPFLLSMMGVSTQKGNVSRGV